MSGKGGSFRREVVRHGEIIGEGYNAVTGTNHPTTHAEIAATRVACKILHRFN